MGDGRFDELLFDFLQRAGSAENMLDAVFHFLYRKTEFLSHCVDEETVQRKLLEYHIKHWKVRSSAERFNRNQVMVTLRDIGGVEIHSKVWDHAPSMWQVMFEAKRMRAGRPCRLLYKTSEWKPSQTLTTLVGDANDCVEITAVWDRSAGPNNKPRAFAFAAIKTDGSVVTWGHTDYDGDSSSVASLLQDGVVQVTGNWRAFAAIKTDGSVVTWGHADYGGDSSSVASLLQDGVVQVTGSNGAFAAIKTDGSVVTWGSRHSGGDSSSVASLLQDGVVQVS